MEPTDNLIKVWKVGHKAGRRAISPLTIHDIRKQLYMLEVTICNMREFLDTIEKEQDEDSDNGC